ncbi:dna repair and recombination protein rad26 [Diplodia corticola]|uniref:Dna repair and recombination protein rad26 n=1 Tax=Diplodia corticola TaxID=236234 RepID=A0A1J9RGW7_9PEZI|nr:dna repair and recombination protein rad26 [Diplodia corticola]OJD39840.1 dna repair and recombination protein rad26 [Diplodia corticola]
MLDPSPSDGGSLSSALSSPKSDIENPAEVDDQVPCIGKGKGKMEETSGAEELDTDGDGDGDEESRLRFLTTVRDQDDIERDIGRQADKMLTEQADERDNKRLQKALTEKQRCTTQLRKLEERLAGPGGSTIKNKIRKDVADMESRIETLTSDVQQIENRIAERHHHGNADDLLEVGGNRQQPNESRRDFLIRTGKITPFSRMARPPKKTAENVSDVLLDAELGEDEDEQEEEDFDASFAPEGSVSHRNLKRPGFAEEMSETGSTISEEDARSAKRRKVKTTDEDDGLPEASSVESPQSDDAYDPGMSDRQLAVLDSTDEELDGVEDDDYDMTTPGQKRKTKPKQAKPREKAKLDGEGADGEEDLADLDDGNEAHYQSRLNKWVKERSAARHRARHRRSSVDAYPPLDEDDEKPEWQQALPHIPDTNFDGGFKVPGDIYPNLFDYQKTGVHWLWELYSQQVGGIIGDEMGLGKTVQAISFIAGLHYSGKLNKPAIVVCPATVMKQWVTEFHTWWPALRVSILHSSGSGMMDMKRESQMEQNMESRSLSKKKPLTKSEKSAKRIVDKVKADGHVLVTTYSGLATYGQFLIPTEWEYAVLDEGHKIRNPDSRVTVYCKELRTANRLILSGTPMQNNLDELWSLFDFVYPMRLGTLPEFRTSFEVPIKLGGYANASNFQVETAMRCAEVLKETISPYLLQRFKVDVAADLPKKTERVLFCRLTVPQRKAYEEFLGSSEMNSILDGKRQALFGIDILRKVCNHPDLIHHKSEKFKSDPRYGSGSKSGKMQVVKELVQMWKREGHKTLLFAQHKIMLDILERFMNKLGNINYLRMDGSTSIKARQDLVDKFNNDPGLDVFLLTTKVGGLGVNLTGADRVIIYDPDWNPSTDVQARERAWRLGQKREVEIYRLMTAGSIEEKIYHRQIFKQFLTNKILRDPKQRQTFHLKDLHDLFTLGNADDETETGNLFQGTETRISGSPTGAREKSPKPDEEMSKIYGIERGEDYRTTETGAKSSGNGEQQAGAQPAGSNKDERLMTTIFARSGVQSSVEHDSIMGSNSKRNIVGPDPAAISRMARENAEKVARELARSAEIARNTPAGTVTWTGEAGTAGRPPTPPPRRDRFATMRGALRGGRGGRGGPSSGSVLSHLSVRQGRNAPTANSAARRAAPATSARGRSSTPLNNGASRSDSASSSRGDTPRPAADRKKDLEGTELFKAIRDFMRTHDGVVYTEMIKQQFQWQVGEGREKAEEFRAMLKILAKLEKPSGGDGRGRWTLKTEWK